MVSVSLRQNGDGVPERNSFELGSDETVYPPIVFTPGKTPEDWVETRTREAGHDRWPHPENPGLIPDAGGYFDWAGRLLFLPDGSPNPDISGAYRYQTRPDLCDPHAPDSESVSPRYEPVWLRHKPGDTWMIGGKPFDPDDPGPYGNPRWRPDRRTGRHRRGERPDPIPPWEWQEGDPEPPDFVATGIRWDAHGDWTPDRIAASGNPRNGAGTVPERAAYQPDPPGSGRRNRPPASDSAAPVPDHHARTPDPGWISGSCTTEPDPDTDAPSTDRTDPDWAFIHRYTGDTDPTDDEPDDDCPEDQPPKPRRAQPKPNAEARRPAPRRPRFWSEEPPDQDERSSSNRWQATKAEPAAAASVDKPQRLTPLQERAWADFLTDSQVLYEEHLEPAAADLRDHLAWFLHWLLWVLAIGLVHRPERPETTPVPGQSATRRSQPHAGRAAVRVPVQTSTRTLPEAVRPDATIGMAAVAFRAGAARGRVEAHAARPAPPPPIAPRLPHLAFHRQPKPDTYIPKWEKEFDLTYAFARVVA